MADDIQATDPSKAIQILRAGDVSVPLIPDDNTVHPEVAKLRERFLSGADLSKFDLQRLILATAEGGGGNGNCNVC